MTIKRMVVIADTYPLDALVSGVGLHGETGVETDMPAIEVLSTLHLIGKGKQLIGGGNGIWVVFRSFVVVDIPYLSLSSIVAARGIVLS